MGDAKSLAHTKWNCKYHIVFAPKYRRQVFYGEKRRAVGDILRKLCEWKDAGSTSKCNTRCLTISVFQKGCIGGFEPQALSWPPV